MRLIDAEALEEEFNWIEKVTNESSIVDKEKHKTLMEDIERIQNAPTVNAIPIPDGATNGDVIREIWHDETLLSNIEYCYGKEWLNAPYTPPKQNLAPADKSGLEYADQPTLQSAT